MFGQPAGTSPFGAATSTPFGAPAGTTPTNAFGSPAPTANAPSTGFGQSTTSFGVPAAAPAFGSAAPSQGFGAPSPATGFGSSVGGFGSPSPAAPAQGFGLAPTPSTPFGAPTPAPSGGLFGAPAPAPAQGGLFGAPSAIAAPAQGGLFGAPAPATGGLFGAAPNPVAAPAGAFGFGAAAPAAPSAFGAAPQPAQGGLFGAPAPAPAQGGLFGAPAASPATGGMFGAPAAAPAAGGLFGSSPAAAMGGAGAGRGSLLVPYQATRKVDGATTINFQSISAMAQYENKSFEELRLEDYMAGNKGSQGQAAPAPTGFGAPAAPTGGLFGAPAPAPAPSTGFGFGGSVPAPSPAGGLFGSPVAAPAFGAPAAAPAYGATGGLFGATPAAAPAAGGLFGAPAAAPAAGGLFGAPAAAPAMGGLFGAPAAAPAAGGLFGAPAAAPAAGGLFGSPPAAAPAMGGLFGAPAAAPAAGGLFGAPAAAPAMGGLFGAPAAAPAAGGLFGAPAPAPAMGGLFGAPAAAPAAGGLFGAPAAAPAMGGLFGAPAAAPAAGGLFGAPAPAPAMGGLYGYGAPAAAPAAPIAPGGTTILVPPASETLLAQQMAAIENQNKELAVLEAWRGGSLSASKRSGNGSTGAVIPTSIYQRDAQAVRYRGLAGGTSSSMHMNGNGNGSATVSILESYQAAPRSAAKIRPRGFGPAVAKSALGQRSTRGMLSPTSFLGSATKQLVIKPGALTPKPKTRLLLSDEAASDKKRGQDAEATPTPGDLIKGRGLENVSGNRESRDNGRDRGLLFENSRIAADKPGFVSPDAGVQQERMTPHSTSPHIASSSKSKGAPNLSPVDESYDFYRSVIGSPAGNGNTENDFGSPVSGNGSINASIPKLTKAGYDVTPSLDALSQMSEADLAAVPNFVVERIGFGSVAWDGAVDVRGIDLDSVVCIEAKAVEVYHKEEEGGSKPSVGTKLNRPAILTLHSVFPKSGPDASAAEKEKFERKIAKKTKEMGSSLVLYDSDIGVWKLHVEHFSRYALDDDSDDEEDDKVEVVEADPTEEMSDFDSGARGGRALYNQVSWTTVEAGQTRFNVPENEDDEMQEANNLVLTNDIEGRRIQAAEAAYAELSQMQGADIQMDMDEPEEEVKSCYVDEGVQVSEYIASDIFSPTSGSSLKISICAQIARRCNVKKATSSATDFGMRMGRSFNVCWRPDGSFLHPASINVSQSHGSKTLVQSRPVIDNGIREEPNLLSVHLKHSAKTNEGHEFPIFSLTHQNDAFLEDFDKMAKMIANKEENNDNALFSISSQAFSLISILFGKVSEDDLFEGIKRKDQGFILWLRNVCAREIEQTIASDSAEGNHYGAIFAALSGNDIPKAASLARANGYNMLALLIANTNPSTGFSLSNQMKQWNESGAINHLPPDLIRIYSLLTRELDIERNMYEEARSTQGQILDWKRRMLMLLKSMIGDPRNGDTLCTSLVKQYESEVASGVSPPATAWFRNCTQDTSVDRNCTLFRLLKVFSIVEGGEDKIPLSTVISPEGHSPNALDLSTSFHLASVMSALGVCGDLSDQEEFFLLESYSSQLQSAGVWEWAVYVSLCCITSKPFSINIERKKRAAMEIICKFYTSENNRDAKKRRSFLENEVGVPTAWFEMALSTSAIQKFEVNKCIEHSASTSTSQALKIYEETILPDVLFNGNKDSCRDIINFLEAMGADNTNVSTLRGAVYDYLMLLRDVSEFSKEGYDNLESTYQILLERASSVQRSLSKLQAKSSSSWKLFNGQNLVPESVTLTELSSSLSHLIAQLNDTMTGKFASQVESNALTFKNSAHPVFSCSNDDFMFNQLDSKAALRGKYRMIDQHVSFNNGLVYRPQRL